MNIKKYAAVILLAAAVLLQGMTVQNIQAAETPPENLYAMSAVLMDGDSGRILYEKEGNTIRPNASTTKVLTCILALENAKGDDYVQVSTNAASQPEVKLGMKKGQQFYMEDLLYSLMLKSHNDTAVAIAENISGSVENFARLMNEKAEEIGCTDTHFVTPNGLDDSNSGGTHHTTAADLARIMRYAIKNKTFLAITQTRDHTFSDISGKYHFSVHNTNAFMDMEKGVLSGKTGFTAKAGYCYVCACSQNGKLMIVALLGCGWPNHKNYKWKDCSRLLKYGRDNYFYVMVPDPPEIPEIPVKNGAPEGFVTGKTVYTQGNAQIPSEDKARRFLMKKGESLSWNIHYPENLDAPVEKGAVIGRLDCMLENKMIFSYPVTSDSTIGRIDYKWYINKVFHDFFH